MAMIVAIIVVMIVAMIVAMVVAMIVTIIVAINVHHLVPLTHPQHLWATYSVAEFFY